MGRIYYTIENREVIINYPVDESGHYLIEWEGLEIGHLYIGIYELNKPVWKGTTDYVNYFAAELGNFIERSYL